MIARGRRKRLLGRVGNQAGDNGFLTLSKVLGLKLRAETVVLSPCVTGRGKVMEEEGVANFARAKYPQPFFWAVFILHGEG